MSSKAIEKLLALATEAERAAASYRLAAAALNGHAVDKRVERSADVLGDALKLDAARRAKPKSKTPKPKRVHTGEATRAKLAIRERTARVLAFVEEKGPLTSAEITAGVGGGGRIGYSPLLQAGFLKRVGDKYKRTAKPFVVDTRQSAAK
jgi:hypothetical protein